MTSDLTITFYSTSPPTGSGRYAKQSKTQYKMPTKSLNHSSLSVSSAEGQMPSVYAASESPLRDSGVFGAQSPSVSAVTLPQNIQQPCTTRYGRAIRKPVKYEPVETVLDDYKPHEYDSDSSNYSSDCST